MSDKTEAALREALEYWLPKDGPFPDQKNDALCAAHRREWDKAKRLLALPTESEPAPEVDAPTSREKEYQAALVRLMRFVNSIASGKYRGHEARRIAQAMLETLMNPAKETP